MFCQDNIFLERLVFHVCSPFLLWGFLGNETLSTFSKDLSGTRPWTLCPERSPPRWFVAAASSTEMGMGAKQAFALWIWLSIITGPWSNSIGIGSSWKLSSISLLLLSCTMLGVELARPKSSIHKNEASPDCLLIIPCPWSPNSQKSSSSSSMTSSHIVSPSSSRSPSYPLSFKLPMLISRAILSDEFCWHLAWDAWLDNSIWDRMTNGNR